MFYIICFILCIINICFSCYLFYKNCLLNDEIDSLYNNYSTLLDCTVKHIPSTPPHELVENNTNNISHSSSERSKSNNVQNLIRNY